MRVSASWNGAAVALALAVIGGTPLAGSTDADAALVCQHERKPLARLRVNACKRNERAVFDTTLSSTRVDRLDTWTTQAAMLFGLTCPQDPTRRLLAVDRDIASGLMGLGYLSGTLCRTLDDDLTSCGQVFESTLYGATACAPLGGKCMPCFPPLEVAGVCRNACQPALGCPSDPMRTIGRVECSQAATPAECAQSWSTSTAYATASDVIRTTSCFWDATAMPAFCAECDPEQTSRGRCSNACIVVAELPRCRAGGRSFGDCSVLDGNPVACGQTYELSPFGTQTCWYDVGPGDCAGCNPLVESMGMCMNGC